MHNIKMVKQDDAYGCAVACLAMVLGKTYADMREEVSKYWETFRMCEQYQGLDHTDEKIILYKHNIQTSYLPASMYTAEDLERLLEGRIAIMTVKSINVQDAYHGVVWNGNTVLDPSRRKVQSKSRALSNCVGARILHQPQQSPMFGIGGTKKPKET